MPIDKKDLIFLSHIPFQLSGEEHLSPSRWCFYLSFNWGLHKRIPPSVAQRLLTLALREKILEKKNETLTIKEKAEFPPLYKFDKKIEPKELANIEPYPIQSEIEYNEVTLRIQETEEKRREKNEPLATYKKAEKPEKAVQTQKEKIKEEKQEEKQQEEEKPEKKAKTSKKQKPKKEKPKVTLDHFTKT